MAHPPIFQVVGYKKSGKTSTLEKLIHYGDQLGDRVAVVKHHGHTTPLDEAHRLNDSARLHENGAFITSVTGADEVQMQMKSSLSLEKMVKWYSFLEPDLILVEGYKKATYPKAVIIKKNEDLELLDLDNIQVVLTWEDNILITRPVPVYSIHHWTENIEELYSIIKGDHHSE
ncbi:molybdopterin-guanine dinucleotide biosynthesis protein B [Halobacillus campisalis]|uniref:Molybdopterin-guanine dinucleotide biosynthesis protein B n=1 Tax=Halobacillus campisalis TaxID=435909 RepID=A0ABW2K3F1_9BACI|nr:molybdopterin-guanine dinucleotide biosynthesis protein B [Halobacillus campisalis]